MTTEISVCFVLFGFEEILFGKYASASAERQAECEHEQMLQME